MFIIVIRNLVWQIKKYNNCHKLADEKYAWKLYKTALLKLIIIWYYITLIKTFLRFIKFRKLRQTYHT